jgi:hypothetical protein
VTFRGAGRGASAGRCVGSCALSGGGQTVANGLQFGVVRVQLEVPVGQLHEVDGCLGPRVVAKQVQSTRGGLGHFRPDRLVGEANTIPTHQASPEDVIVAHGRRVRLRNSGIILPSVLRISQRRR